MLENGSASRVFTLVPDIIEKLLNMMTERNSCFCAQIASVLTMLVVRCYEEMGKRWYYISTFIDLYISIPTLLYSELFYYYNIVTRFNSKINSNSLI